MGEDVLHPAAKGKRIIGGICKGGTEKRGGRGQLKYGNEEGSGSEGRRN